MTGLSVARSGVPLSVGTNGVPLSLTGTEIPVTVTMGAAQSSGMTTPPVSSSPMSQAFTVSNWGSASSPGFLKCGTWFCEGDVPAGSFPAVSNKTVQFYGMRYWPDGSMARANMLLRDADFAAGETRTLTMGVVSQATPAGSVAANGNTGLVAALTGHDVKLTYANVKNWNFTASNGTAYGSGAFTASLAAHAAKATRWRLLSTGPVADVWKGWGMATDNASGSPDAHLKVNWYVTRFKNADGSTFAFQIGAVTALDWWSVAGATGLTYDATLLDGSTTLGTFPAIQHTYRSQWLACINDGSVNAGKAPFIGATIPSLFRSFDQQYLVSTGLVASYRIGRPTTPAPQFAYVPCMNVADTNPDGSSHRYFIDAVGLYQGRGAITRFDADAFMDGTPAAYAVARTNSLSGLSVPYHCRSNNQRTRSGEAADVANTNIVLRLRPKAASAYDFTAQGLPAAVDGYRYLSGSAFSNADQDYYVQPLDWNGTATKGPWGLSQDSSHCVAYSYFMALIEGDEWLIDSSIDLAMNLAHQNIYGYHQLCTTFPATYNMAGADTTQWSGLLGQFQQDNLRYVGWAQQTAGYAAALMPADHEFAPAYTATWSHSGDYVQANLDTMPADFKAAGYYTPNNGLLAGMHSPWMGALSAAGAYAAYLATKAPWEKSLGDWIANWTLDQAEAERWYMWDTYRTAMRASVSPWNATSNPCILPHLQGYCQITPSLKGATGLFTNDQVAQYDVVGYDAPLPKNGDLVYFTRQTDGSMNGVLPSGVADGTKGYVVNLSANASFPARSVLSPPATFQISATPGGAPMSFSGDATMVNMAYCPQSPADYPAATNDPNNFLHFPFLPNWDNYVPMHFAVLNMAYAAGNPRATKVLRDGSVKFIQAMLDRQTGYLPMFDIVSTT